MTTVDERLLQSEAELRVHRNDGWLSGPRCLTSFLIAGVLQNSVQLRRYRQFTIFDDAQPNLLVSVGVLLPLAYWLYTLYRA